ncbi:hypothetical protein PIB30_042335 [Stylosanthes scabra]|uniref:B3 domain-containing protein n=1 Tax=Stylosanthes scabra TaxID=79078 RepID=A0ABU6SFD6_9FABA|nr:hypothetical protein [Stylosanthes scabra]
MARIKFTFPWFECGRNSSSSDKNNLKEPHMVDADNTTAEVMSSRKRKRRNAFLESDGSSGDGRTAERNKDNMMMNIKKTERSCLVQENNQHCFNDTEFEVAEILHNLGTFFLERLKSETSKNSSPSNVSASSTDKEKVSKNTSKTTLTPPRVSPMRRERTRAVNQPSSELPENFKNVIRNMGGSEITFVIEKSLCMSDLNRQQNRLSIPSAKVKDTKFLLKAELTSLDDKGEIKVKLIQPSLEIGELSLVKWFMAKENGSVSSSFILRSNWMNVAEANKLKENDVVQVWSFRVEEKLCIAIVKL